MFPPQPRLSVAPKLTEPLYSRQAEETADEYAAFGTWVDCRDWLRVGALMGLSQPEALDLSARWAWHARTSAWDREQTQAASSDRKAHQEATRAAREALPGLLAQQASEIGALWDFVHAEQIRHKAAADAQAAGTAGGVALPSLPWREVLMTIRVAEQGTRDLERMARPSTPDSVSTAAGQGWDFSTSTPEQLKTIQAARAAAKRA